MAWVESRRETRLAQLLRARRRELHHELPFDLHREHVRSDLQTFGAEYLADRHSGSSTEPRAHRRKVPDHAAPSACSTSDAKTPSRVVRSLRSMTSRSSSQPIGPNFTRYSRSCVMRVPEPSRSRRVCQRMKWIGQSLSATS